MDTVKLLSLIKSKMGFVILILLIQLIFAYYIFNFTSQEKNPSQLFELLDKPSEIIYTINGELVTGTEKGMIYYYNLGEFEPSGIVPKKVSPLKPDLLWKYDLGSPIESMTLSSNRVFLSAIDGEGEIYLFMTIDGKLLWKKYLGRTGIIEGIGGTFGEFGASVEYQTIVVSSGEGYLCDCKDGDPKGSILYVFMPKSPDPLWTFDSDVRAMRGAVSANGNRIAAGDSEGNVYYFSWKSKEPLWKRKFENPVKNVRISYTGSRIAVLLEGGNPNLYVLDEESHKVSSFFVPEEVKDMFISFDAGTVYALTEKNIYGFSPDEWKYSFEERVDSIFIPPHGSYVILGGSNLSQLYYGRSVPLWSKPIEDKVFYATPNGEYTIIMRGNLLEIYSNLSITPLGDRTLWGIWFLIFVLLAAIFFPKRHIPKSTRAWAFTSALGILGFFWGFVQASSLTPIATGFIFAIGLGVSFLVAFLGEGALYDLPLGWISGTGASALSGIVVAIVFWIQGVEQPLNAEIFFLSIGALQTGTRICIVGALLGFISKRVLGGGDG